MKNQTKGLLLWVATGLVIVVLLTISAVSRAEDLLEEQQPEPTHVVITINSVNQILQYLGTRPYAEVAGIIAGLQTAQLITVPLTNSKEE